MNEEQSKEQSLPSGAEVTSNSIQPPAPIVSLQAWKTKKNERRSHYGLMPGYTWNPLLGLPRNRPCPCLSGAKFKQCCLHKLPKAIPIEAAEEFIEQMKKPDLVFVTRENEEYLKARAAELNLNLPPDMIAETPPDAPQAG